MVELSVQKDIFAGQHFQCDFPSSSSSGLNYKGNQAECGVLDCDRVEGLLLRQQEESLPSRAGLRT